MKNQKEISKKGRADREKKEEKIEANRQRFLQNMAIIKQEIKQKQDDMN